MLFYVQQPDGKVACHQPILKLNAASITSPALTPKAGASPLLKAQLPPISISPSFLEKMQLSPGLKNDELKNGVQQSSRAKDQVQQVMNSNGMSDIESSDDEESSSSKTRKVKDDEDSEDEDSEEDASFAPSDSEGSEDGGEETSSDGSRDSPRQTLTSLLASSMARMLGPRVSLRSLISRNRRSWLQCMLRYRARKRQPRGRGWRSSSSDREATSSQSDEPDDLLSEDARESSSSSRPPLLLTLNGSVAQRGATWSTEGLKEVMGVRGGQYQVHVDNWGGVSRLVRVSCRAHCSRAGSKRARRRTAAAATDERAARVEAMEGLMG